MATIPINNISNYMSSFDTTFDFESVVEDNSILSLPKSVSSSFDPLNLGPQTYQIELDPMANFNNAPLIPEFGAFNASISMGDATGMDELNARETARAMMATMGEVTSHSFDNSVSKTLLDLIEQTPLSAMQSLANELNEHDMPSGGLGEAQTALTATFDKGLHGSDYREAIARFGEASVKANIKLPHPFDKTMENIFWGGVETAFDTIQNPVAAVKAMATTAETNLTASFNLLYGINGTANTFYPEGAAASRSAVYDFASDKINNVTTNVSNHYNLGLSNVLVTETLARGVLGFGVAAAGKAAFVDPLKHRPDFVPEQAVKSVVHNAVSDKVPLDMVVEQAVESSIDTALKRATKTSSTAMGNSPPTVRDTVHTSIAKAAGPDRHTQIEMPTDPLSREMFDWPSISWNEIGAHPLKDMSAGGVKTFFPISQKNEGHQVLGVYTPYNRPHMYREASAAWLFSEKVALELADGVDLPVLLTSGFALADGKTPVSIHPETGFNTLSTNEGVLDNEGSRFFEKHAPYITQETLYQMERIKNNYPDILVDNFQIMYTQSNNGVLLPKLFGATMLRTFNQNSDFEIEVEPNVMIPERILHDRHEATIDQHFQEIKEIVHPSRWSVKWLTTTR